MRYRNFAGIMFAGLLCGVSTAAESAEVSINIDVPADEIGITTFDVSGFRFTADSGLFSMREYSGGGSQDYFFFGSGDPALPAAVPLTQVSIERIGGGSFDFVRFDEIADAAGIFDGLGVQTLTSDRGGALDLYFDVSNPDFSVLLGSADAPALFTNISRLTFTELQPSFAAYDNFVFRVADAAEPGALALCAAAALAWAFMRRLMRRRQARL